MRSPAGKVKRAVISCDGVSPGAAEAALPDNQLVVDGELMEWTDTADKSILCVCMIRAQGRPSAEHFESLVSEMNQKGCMYTVPQVEARFTWLKNRFLARDRQ